MLHWLYVVVAACFAVMFIGLVLHALDGDE